MGETLPVNGHWNNLPSSLIQNQMHVGRTHLVYMIMEGWGKGDMILASKFVFA